MAAPSSPLLSAMRRLDGVGGEVDVGGEVLHQDGRAIEADDGDVVGHVADDGLDHGREGAVLVQLARAGASALDVDDEGERLAAGVLFEREFLRDAVVGEGEVIGLEGEDEIAGLGAHQRGNEDEGGVRVEGRSLLGRSGRGLREDEGDCH